MKKVRKNSKYVFLKKDFVFVAYGKKITYKAGTKFGINPNNYFDENGDFCMVHFYAYNCGEKFQQNISKKRLNTLDAKSR